MLDLCLGVKLLAACLLIFAFEVAQYLRLLVGDSVMIPAVQEGAAASEKGGVAAWSNCPSRRKSQVRLVLSPFSVLPPGKHPDLICASLELISHLQVHQPALTA